jgi:hypothetical protein
MKTFKNSELIHYFRFGTVGDALGAAEGKSIIDPHVSTRMTIFLKKLCFCYFFFCACTLCEKK